MSDLPVASSGPPSTLRRVVDGLLVLLLAVVTFLLGVVPLDETDFWWHLAGGEWILHHGRAPGLDPFTFGSADRVWIDVQWLFQIPLALAYRAGEASGVTLLMASIASLVVLVGCLARGPLASVPLTIACWAPAIFLASWRFSPRPENVSLLWLVIFLAILGGMERRPWLAWGLPVVQVLWVNSHALFVFGPILLAFYWLDRAGRPLQRTLAKSWWKTSPGVAEDAPGDPALSASGWRHLVGASVAVVAVCFVNPYFIDGALFPLELYGKVTDEANVYKKYVDEFKSPAAAALGADFAHSRPIGYFLALYFLEIVLSISFLHAAVRDTLALAAPDKPELRRSWSQATWGLIALTLLSTFTSLLLMHSGLATMAGDAVPLLMLLVALWSLYRFTEASRLAAFLAAFGVFTVALCTDALHLSLLGRPAVIPSFVHLLIVPALTVWCLAAFAAGTRLTALLTAVVFGGLALTALRNTNLFAVAAAVVAVWNFRPRESAVGEPASPDSRRVDWLPRVVLAAGLMGWIAAVVGLPSYHALVGRVRSFGLGEAPFAFPHGAARFAGQASLPDKAIVFNFARAGVYVYHNGPARKVYMDARLELPTVETFNNYVAIESQLRGSESAWRESLRKLGDPLVLVAHRGNAASQAHLFTHRDYLCLFYDAVGSVFVTREQAAASGLPPIDFVRRHFAPRERVAEDEPGAALETAQALARVGEVLKPSSATTWTARLPIYWDAADRVERAMTGDASPRWRLGRWTLLGDCLRGQQLDPNQALPSLAEPWSTTRDAAIAQAAACYRREAETNPSDKGGWTSLYYLCRELGALDAATEAGDRATELEPMNGYMALELKEDQTRLAQMLISSDPDLTKTIENLLANGRPLTAWRTMERLPSKTSPENTLAWTTADRLASACLRMGLAGAAEEVWRHAANPPSESLRLGRLAAAKWVSRDLAGAESLYRDALAADPTNAEAAVSAALLAAQFGQLKETRAALQRATTLELDPATRANLASLEKLLAEFGDE